MALSSPSASSTDNGALSAQENDEQVKTLFETAKKNIIFKKSEFSREEFDQRVLRLCQQQIASFPIFEQLSKALQYLSVTYQAMAEEDAINDESEEDNMEPSSQKYNPSSGPEPTDQSPSSTVAKEESMYPQFIVRENRPLVVIGSNGTVVRAQDYQLINWSSATIATRALLQAIFSCKVLATHTLSGAPSPAFRGRERPRKGKLDPIKVADIISIVVAKTGCKEREVRASITTKCSDAAKTMRKRSQRQLNRNVAN